MSNIDANFKKPTAVAEKTTRHHNDTKPLPLGMEEVPPLPEIVKRKSAKAVRYNELWEAVQAAHSRGKILAVDVDLYWKSMTPRGIYMSLRRTRLRHKWPIEFNHTRAKTEGKVYLWIDPDLEGQFSGKQSVSRRPGRPQKAE